MRQLFVRAAGGEESLRELAAWARSVGLKTTHGNAMDRLGVRKILGNRIYTGQAPYKGTWHDGQHEALIDTEVFASVQTALTQRRRPYLLRPWGRQPYPLSGVAVCASCRAPLLGSKGGKHGVRYLRCSTTARQGREACRQPMVRAGLLEAQVGAYFDGFQVPPIEEERALDAVRLLVEDPAAARAFQRSVAPWKALVADGQITEAEYAKRLNALQERYEPTRTVVIDERRATERLKDTSALWEETDDAGRRALATEIFDAVVVDGQELAEIHPAPSYRALFAHDRDVRFGGEMGWCSLAPRAGLEPTT